MLCCGQRRQAGKGRQSKQHRCLATGSGRLRFKQSSHTRPLRIPASTRHQPAHSPAHLCLAQRRAGAVGLRPRRRQLLVKHSNRALRPLKLRRQPLRIHAAVAAATRACLLRVQGRSHAAAASRHRLDAAAGLGAAGPAAVAVGAGAAVPVAAAAAADAQLGKELGRHLGRGGCWAALRVGAAVGLGVAAGAAAEGVGGRAAAPPRGRQCGGIPARQRARGAAARRPRLHLGVCACGRQAASGRQGPVLAACSRTPVSMRPSPPRCACAAGCASAAGCPAAAGVRTWVR